MDRLQLLPCPVLITDLQGNMLDASHELVDLLLHPDGSWRGQSMNLFLPPASRVFLQTHLWPTLFRTGALREAHLKLRGLDGHALPVMLNARTVELDGQPRCMWVFFVAKDRSRFETELINARARAQALARDLEAANDQLRLTQHQLRQQAQTVEARNQELDVLSQTDPLTGLGNRRMLENTFATWQQSLRADTHGTRSPVRPPQASVLLVDADHFKRINDTWGHGEGDRVLVELATALQVSVRRSDLVVRQGGEEFIVWLPAADALAAIRVADAIHRAVATILPGGAPPHLTVSIGVATTADTQGPVDLATLVCQADAATYQAKAQGRNQTVHTTHNAPPAAHPPPPQPTST